MTELTETVELTPAPEPTLAADAAPAVVLPRRKRFVAFARAAGGISAMQSINVVIVNPLFLVVFFGTAALSILLAIVALVRLSEPGALYILAGGLIYLAGSILVTMVFNVPLNNALAAVKPDSAEGESFWRRYLSVWTAWNHARTVACLAACASFILALR